MNTTKVALARYEDSHCNSYQNPCTENEGQGKVTLRLTELLGFGKTAQTPHTKSASEHTPHLLLILTLDRKKIPTISFKSLLG